MAVVRSEKRTEKVTKKNRKSIVQKTKPIFVKIISNLKKIISNIF